MQSTKKLEKNISLHHLVREASSEELATILKYHNDLEETDNRNRTALHIAVAQDKYDIVALLLDQGASINARDIDGKTPLHLAMPKTDSTMANYLIEKGASLTLQDTSAQAPFHLALYYGHINLIKKIFNEKNAYQLHELLELKDESHKNVLHYAALNGTLEIVELLVKQGMDVNSNTLYDYTPLHYAARQGHFEVARYLIQTGAKADAKTTKGETALVIALRFYHFDVARYLSQVSPKYSQSLAHFAEGQLADILLLGEQGLMHHDIAKAKTCFMQVIESTDISTHLPLHVHCLARLGEFHTKEEEYIAAATYYTAALTYAEQATDAQHINSLKRIQEKITKQLAKLETDMGIDENISKTDSPTKSQSPSGIKDLQNNWSALSKLREKIKAYDSNTELTMSEKAEHTTTLIKEFIKNLFDNCLKKIGPVPCRFALIGLNDLAHSLMLERSEIQCMLIISDSDPEKQHYFKRVIQLFSLSILNLRETPCPSIPDDKQPIRAGLRLATQNLTETSELPFQLVPVDEMASLIDNPNYPAENLLSFLSGCLITGNATLLQATKKRLNKKLAKQNPSCYWLPEKPSYYRLALSALNDIALKFENNLKEINDHELPVAIIPMRQAFLNFVYAVALLNRIKLKTPIETLKKLISQNIINESVFKIITDSFNYLLKIQQSAFHKTGCDPTAVLLHKPSNQTASSTTRNKPYRLGSMLSQFMLQSCRGLLQLTGIIQPFCNSDGDSNFLKNAACGENTPLWLALAYHQLGDYNNTKTQLEFIRKNDSSRSEAQQHEVLCLEARLLAVAGNFQQALELYDKRINQLAKQPITKEIVVQIKQLYEDQATIYLALNKFEKSMSCLQIALDLLMKTFQQRHPYVLAVQNKIAKQAIESTSKHNMIPSIEDYLASISEQLSEQSTNEASIKRIAKLPMAPNSVDKTTTKTKSTIQSTQKSNIFVRTNQPQSDSPASQRWGNLAKTLKSIPVFVIKKLIELDLQHNQLDNSMKDLTQQVQENQTKIGNIELDFLGLKIDMGEIQNQINHLKLQLNELGQDLHRSQNALMLPDKQRAGTGSTGRYASQIETTLINTLMKYYGITENIFDRTQNNVDHMFNIGEDITGLIPLPFIPQLLTITVKLGSTLYDAHKKSRYAELSDIAGDIPNIAKVIRLVAKRLSTCFENQLDQLTEKSITRFGECTAKSLVKQMLDRELKKQLDNTTKEFNLVSWWVMSIMVPKPSSSSFADEKLYLSDKTKKTKWTVRGLLQQSGVMTQHQDRCKQFVVAKSSWDRSHIYGFKIFNEMELTLFSQYIAAKEKIKNYKLNLYNTLPVLPSSKTDSQI